MRRSTGRRGWVGRCGRDSAGAARRRYGRSVRSVGEGQDLEHAGRRRLPFRAGVELGPGAAEGDEDLRGDQEHGQRGVQAELAPEQAQAQDHGDETDAESGDEVHGQGREERHPQRPHGGDTNALGGLDDLTAAVPVAPEGAQVGSPSMSWRNRPASDPRRRHCRAVRRLASRPK